MLLVVAVSAKRTDGTALYLPRRTIGCFPVVGVIIPMKGGQGGGRGRVGAGLHPGDNGGLWLLSFDAI